MARNRGDDSFVAHTKSAVAPVKSSAICDYVAPRFRENATPESIISTICAPHSGRNCRRSAKGVATRHDTYSDHHLRGECGRYVYPRERASLAGAVRNLEPTVIPTAC